MTLSPRIAVILAALLFAASVVLSVFGTLKPPESTRAGVDSYATGREGSQALVDLLDELGIPVERQLLPPTADFPLDATVLLIAPDPILVRTEPEPLKRLAAWVRRGGCVIVAPDFATPEQEKQILQMSEEFEHFEADVLATLGLSAVRCELMLSSDVPTTVLSDDGELIASTVAKSSQGPASDELEELVTLGDALPEILWDDGVEPIGETRILDAERDERVLAARFALGRGEIMVIGDSTLLSNVTLRRGDNAVWLVRNILAGGRTRAIVDEFYHGRSVRGNAWWLLTRPPLAALAITGLLGLGLWTWRSGVLLGAPLSTQPTSRRAMGEYIDAMSRFFLRSRQATPFLLEQLRAGVWRSLSHEFGLPPGQNDLERLQESIRRRDPARAEQVVAAFRACDHSLRDRDSSKADQLAAMAALSRTVRVASPMPR